MTYSLFQEGAAALPVLGFGTGRLFIYRGMRFYRETLLVGDTPAIPIRSVAMGLVQVHGVAKGEGAFPSPVSEVPCYAFKVKIERWRASNRMGWYPYRTDVNGARFYLEDDTGRVQVDPRGAEFHLPKNCRRTVPELPWSMWFDKEADLPPLDVSTGASAFPVVRSDDDLLEYAGGAAGVGADNYRFTEYCIRPGYKYYVFGTCTESPHPNGPDDRNLITKGQNEQTYLVSSKAAAQLERNLRWKSALMVWGGVALATACAVLLLAEFALF